MRPFENAYSFHRLNDNEIYKGFGFSHLSDASNYYLPLSDDFDDKNTILSQSIGEAIILFSLIDYKENKSNFYYSESNNIIFVDILIDDDWRENKIVDKNVYRYLVLLEKKSIKISVFDKLDNYLNSSTNDIQDFYILLPAFYVLLAKMFLDDSHFSYLIIDFSQNPTIDKFVYIHETFYRAFKNDRREIVHFNLSFFDLSNLTSYKTILEKLQKNNLTRNQFLKAAQQKFPIEYFNQETLEFVNVYKKEIGFSETISNICYLFENTNIKTIFLNKSINSLKTIQCKLVFQKINIPIKERAISNDQLEDFILGINIIGQDKIIFKISYLTDVLINGGNVVFENFDLSLPHNISLLNTLLDDSGIVKLEDGEIINIHPNFNFFALANYNVYEQNDLDESEKSEVSTSRKTNNLLLVTRINDSDKLTDHLIYKYRKNKDATAIEELEFITTLRYLKDLAKKTMENGYIRICNNKITSIKKGDAFFDSILKETMLMKRSTKL